MAKKPKPVPVGTEPAPPPEPANPLNPLPKTDPQFHTVERFWRGICDLLPNVVPAVDQTALIAIAVRMSAADRDLLLAILERGVS